MRSNIDIFSKEYANIIPLALMKNIPELDYSEIMTKERYEILCTGIKRMTLVEFKKMCEVANIDPVVLLHHYSGIEYYQKCVKALLKEELGEKSNDLYNALRRDFIKKNPDFMEKHEARAMTLIIPFYAARLSVKDTSTEELKFFADTAWADLIKKDIKKILGKEDIGMELQNFLDDAIRLTYKTEQLERNPMSLHGEEYNIPPLVRNYRHQTEGQNPRNEDAPMDFYTGSLDAVKNCLQKRDFDGIRNIVGILEQYAQAEEAEEKAKAKKEDFQKRLLNYMKQ